MQGIGVDAGPQRCNPLIWPVRFRDGLSQEAYARIGRNFFRVHYQFITANDQRAPYDYFMLVCGPVPVPEWAAYGRSILSAFAADASYVEHRPAAVIPG